MSDGLLVHLEQDQPIALNARISCAPGEILALVGPSGSGKSTLLRSIAGLYQPLSGKIECAGELWFDSASKACLPTARRRVGMVFQQFALFPHLSAEDNVAEAMLDHPPGERQARARDWLERVHLSGLHQRLPHQLSGGQQQRVALARALAREPKVLLLDEPFSAVDRVTREALHTELAELRESFRMPVILVTHDLEEATLLADRLCVLDKGTTLQTGSPDALLQSPESAAVARMLGMRNIFNGTVLAHEHDHSLLGWAGQILKVRPQPHLPVGLSVNWVIPTSGVLLMPLTGRPGTPLDNHLPVKIERMLSMGEQYRVSLTASGQQLTMNVANHVAQRYGLHCGESIEVRLRGETIHLMQA